MAKLLKGIHLGLLAVLGLYASEEIIRWITKIVNPTDQSVKFWQPGPEVVVVAASFLLLSGIFVCSVGIAKNPSWRLLTILHGLWLACFTWFGWFSVGGPFRLKELVRIDLADASAVGRAGMSHLLQALGVYLAIVFISEIPLLVRWSGERHKDSGANSPGEGPNPVFH